MIDERLLKNEEKAVYSLRCLYRKYGYLPFKMKKFEEYELYIRSKDFSLSDRIITFTDTNGKLLALKPDVTLSIIKNGEDITGCKQKVFYNENVYRVSGKTKQYKEIMQAGLECIGDIDLYDVYEAIYLAALSLEVINPSYVLEISHLGILSAVLDDIHDDQVFKDKAIQFISEKNSHDLKSLCEKHNICDEDYDKLNLFIRTYGNRQKVLNALRPLCKGAAEESYNELATISALLDNTDVSDNIIIDFSVVNDMNYYNDIVFKGFIDGICDGVLSGGRYDKLMQKMERSSGACGFAIYLDNLELLKKKTEEYDVDILIIYDESADMKSLAETVDKYIKNGQRVSAQKAVPPRLRYRELIYLGKENCNA